MSVATRRMAGFLFVLMPTVVFGGTSILTLLVNDPAYAQNPLRQDLWRAGHAHAAVLLVLSLVALRYVDEAALSPRWRHAVRGLFPVSALVLPAAFFLSVLDPTATEPNGLIGLAYVGALALVTGMIALGVGLLRPANDANGGDASRGMAEHD